MKAMVNLNDLMEEQLRNMYDGETRLVKALDKVGEKAEDTKLKEIITDYTRSNEDQILRLKQVFNLLFTQKRGEKCEAVCALIKEAEEIIDRSMESTVMDAGIITALQHIIHYQIASYGAICNYANTLGLYDVAGIVHKNLEEVKRTDKELAKVAEAVVNLKAV